MTDAPDPNSSYQMKMTTTLGPSVQGARTPEEAEQRASTWGNFANIDDGVLQSIRERKSVTKEAYDEAQRARSHLLGDREWVKKYLDGDQGARKQMAMVSIILGSRIAEPPVTL